jgi:hypothetical protein
VATDGNISLRLVAFAPQKPALSETESDARANNSKGKKLSAFSTEIGSGCTSKIHDDLTLNAAPNSRFYLEPMRK